ncbi:head scaffolding protein [Cronobacter phage Dev-CD-23823]|uniref:Scaffolding protein n=1 Tax=Cronobacter phage Dev-CD-23823 TaxID=1712539 RepID=A0A0K8IXB9_9CAUD|nr:head scaffolding protein [Cronobacter phage Dev-CD-23823]CUH74609.1 Scaffolding protein [Cronobacter phage Dev-CD-23823]
MLFMNIARKFGGHVFMSEEGGAEQGGGGGAAPEASPEAAPEKAEKVTLGTPEAKPEPTPEAKPEVTETPEDNGMQQYIDKYSEENPALGLALGFLRDAGISPTDPAFALAETEGDFELLKAALATKGLPGTDAMVAILEKAVGEHFAAIEAHEQKTAQIVGEILGDQKDEILEWARSTADDTEKEAFNDMFEAGGVYARAAAVLLQQAYSGTGATIPAKSAAQVTTGPGTGANTPLTAREYATAVSELAHKLQGDPRGTAEYQALTRRREIGRSRGL